MSHFANHEKEQIIMVPEKDTEVMYSPDDAPFKIYGLMKDENGYCRMPIDVADRVSPNVSGLSRNTAGGRIRFATDSEKIKLRALVKPSKMSHFAFTGSIGFDLYSNGQYAGTFIPDTGITDTLERELSIPQAKKGKLNEICINFPLYSNVTKVELGFSAGSRIAEPEPYAIEKPVVYYGSSITQGGCASRPGNAYQAILTRRFDCDHINLGFSGSAKAEDAMAEYIASLDMSVFVYDYDCNAPDPDYLSKTHEKMFQTIRKAHPDLPVVMVTRPMPRLDPVWAKRRDIVMRTYLNARESGDENVRFVDGSAMMNVYGGDSCTVDGVHPNDLGFSCMALGIGNALATIWGY